MHDGARYHSEKEVKNYLDKNVRYLALASSEPRPEHHREYVGSPSARIVDQKRQPRNTDEVWAKAREIFHNFS